jgi:hypothetical protein
MRAKGDKVTANDALYPNFPLKPLYRGLYGKPGHRLSPCHPPHGNRPATHL